MEGVDVIQPIERCTKLFKQAVGLTNDLGEKSKEIYFQYVVHNQSF